MPDERFSLPADKLEDAALADMDRVVKTLMQLREARASDAPNVPALTEQLRLALTRVGVTIDMLPEGPERNDLSARLKDLQDVFGVLRKPL